jgi:hypothetical protein
VAFWDAYKEVNIFPGMQEMCSFDPKAFCQVSDVPTIEEGDMLTINSINYYVKDAHLDGEGGVMVLLSKDGIS